MYEVYVQSCVELKDYSIMHFITSLHSKCHITELPLKVGGAKASKDAPDIYASMTPLTYVQPYGILNAVIQLKPAAQYLHGTVAYIKMIC